MTAPTTTIAWSTAKEIARLIGLHANCATITVWSAWPGDKHVKPDMVWIEDLRAPTVNVPVSQAGRLQRDETVTMDVKVGVAGRRTVDDAMTRVAELVAAVQDTLANLTGTAITGVTGAEVVAYEMNADELNDGRWMATGSVSLTFEIRLL